MSNIEFFRKLKDLCTEYNACIRVSPDFDEIEFVVSYKNILTEKFWIEEFNKTEESVFSFGGDRINFIRE